MAWKPEGKMRWDAATFKTWLPQTVAGLCDEANAAGKLLEVEFEHRAEGDFEFRIRPSTRPRMFDLPPIQIVR